MIPVNVKFKHWWFFYFWRKHLLGMLSRGSLLVQVSCSRFDKEHMRALTFRPQIYLASLAAVPLLMFRSFCFCCTTNKPPILRLYFWGKAKRSNRWLGCPHSLLQDWCVLELLLGTQVANMIPPHHCTTDCSSVTMLIRCPDDFWQLLKAL